MNLEITIFLKSTIESSDDTVMEVLIEMSCYDDKSRYYSGFGADLGQS